MAVATETVIGDDGDDGDAIAGPAAAATGAAVDDGDDDVRIGATGIVRELEDDVAQLEHHRTQSLQHVVARIDDATKKRTFYAYNDAESYAFHDVRLEFVTPSEFTCAFALRSNAGDRQ